MEGLDCTTTTTATTTANYEPRYACAQPNEQVMADSQGQRAEGSYLGPGQEDRVQAPTSTVAADGNGPASGGLRHRADQRRARPGL